MDRFTEIKGPRGSYTSKLGPVPITETETYGPLCGGRRDICPRFVVCRCVYEITETKTYGLLSGQAHEHFENEGGTDTPKS